MKKILPYVLAYAMLALLIVLGIRLFIVSQSAFRSFWGAVYVHDLHERSLQVRAFEKLFTIFIGSCLFLFWLAAEQFFKRAIAKKNMLQRFAQFFGLEIAFIFLSDLILALAGGVNLADWMGWLLILVELLASAGLLYYARALFLPARKKALASL